MSTEPNFSDDIIGFVEDHGYKLTDWQKRYLRYEFAKQDRQIIATRLAERAKTAAEPTTEGA